MTKYLTRIISTTVIISAGIVVALVGVPASAIATDAAQSAHFTSGHSAPGTQRCSTSQLRLSVIGRQGALGTTYWDLGLQNVGRTACHMRGYPGVGLVDRNGRLINVPVQRVPGHPEPTIRLRTGQSAYFTFEYPSLVGPSRRTSQRMACRSSRRASTSAWSCVRTRSISAPPRERWPTRRSFPCAPDCA
jgi:hypothetical protein